MSRRASRERAEQGVVLRSRGLTWAEIASRLGYSGRGAAERAVTYELRRTSPESPSEARRFLLSSARDTARAWHERFEAAAAAGDIEAMVSAHNGLYKDREQQARLTGANAPQQVAVGISAEQFGADAAKLIEEIGAVESMRILAQIPGASAALPPALRDRVLAERVAPIEDEDDGTPWSNIGTDEPHRPPCAVYDASAGTVTYPGGERGSTAESEPNFPLSVDPVADAAEPEVLAEIVDEVIEVIEVVTLPPGQKRIPAGEVLDSKGRPPGRGGVPRWLDGIGGNRGRYDPLRGSMLGRSPSLSGPDPMPTRTPPSRG